MSGCPREDILSFEEIARLVDVFADLGVDKVRLTGGEPLLRKDLDRLVAMLAGDRAHRGSRPHHERNPARRAGAGAPRRRACIA